MFSLETYSFFSVVVCVTIQLVKLQSRNFDEAFSSCIFVTYFKSTRHVLFSSLHLNLKICRSFLPRNLLLYSSALRWLRGAEKWNLEWMRRKWRNAWDFFWLAHSSAAPNSWKLNTPGRLAQLVIFNFKLRQHPAFCLFPPRSFVPSHNTTTATSQSWLAWLRPKASLSKESLFQVDYFFSPRHKTKFMTHKNTRCQLASVSTHVRAVTSRVTPRPTLSQFWCFKILHTTFLNFIKFADLLIARLLNCEKAGRVFYVLCQLLL